MERNRFRAPGRYPEVCGECGSDSLVMDSIGYIICRNCGLVQEFDDFIYRTDFGAGHFGLSGPDPLSTISPISRATEEFITRRYIYGNADTGRGYISPKVRSDGTERDVSSENIAVPAILEGGGAEFIHSEEEETIKDPRGRNKGVPKPLITVGRTGEGRDGTGTGTGSESGDMGESDTAVSEDGSEGSGYGADTYKGVGEHTGKRRDRYVPGDRKDREKYTKRTSGGGVGRRRVRVIKNAIDKDYEKTVMREAYREIRTICSGLELPESLIPDIFTEFRKIRKILRPNTMERSVSVLVPVIIYRVARRRNINITEKELANVMSCSVSKFRKVLKRTYNLFPKMVDRGVMILGRILEACDRLALPSDIRLTAIAVFKTIGDRLKSTVPGVAAGTVLLLALAVERKRKDYPLRIIGEAVGASYSAIAKRTLRTLRSLGFGRIMGLAEVDIIAPIYREFLTAAK